MFKQIEAPASKWGMPSRAVGLDKKIFELELVRSLIPTEDDFLKYSMTTDEVNSIPIGPKISGDPLVRWQNAINGIMVILRKRDAESPEVPIDFCDLRDAIRVLINDEPYGDVASFVLRDLQKMGLIEGSRGRFGNISIVRPKIEIEG